MFLLTLFVCYILLFLLILKFLKWEKEIFYRIF